MNGLQVLLVLVIVDPSRSADMFLNEWSVKIAGGPAAADHFALENGFVNLGQGSILQNSISAVNFSDKFHP
jgi:hypothetical protein